MDFSGKYIFIRYNPDKFKDKYGKKTKNPYFETRVEVSEKAIERHILRIQVDDNSNLIEIHHLFYDEVYFFIIVLDSKKVANFFTSKLFFI